MLARHFLGWNRSPLDLAADWIAENLGSDQGELIVALPTARAGRGLKERLARRLGPTWTPPRIVTAGTLTDALVNLESPSAPRLARTLAWVRALQEAPAAERDRIVSAPPEEDDLIRWMHLAGEVRALFGELAAEEVTFADVAGGPAQARGGAGEGARWVALARAQDRMKRFLEEEGLCDPHLARLDAIESGKIERSRVLLVGVIEINGMTRRLLRELEGDALVFAPDDLAMRFDDFGAAITEAWSQQHTSLSIDQWHVVEQPVQQAEKAIEVLAGFGDGRFRAEEITLGVARPSVTPYLCRRLAAQGVTARDAAGLQADRTAPARLLAGWAQYLADPCFGNLSNLMRAPEWVRALRKTDDSIGHHPARSADAYHAEHLPHRPGGKWPADPTSRRDQACRDDVRAVERATQEVLGELTSTEPRRLVEWVPALRRAFEAVYGDELLKPEESEPGRRLTEALALVGQALGDLESGLPGQLGPKTSAAEAAEIALVELRSAAVPPPPPVQGEPTVELLGWFELALDEAPALVVTGFDEGCVPETPTTGGWLPDSARTELGLPDNASRLARELYTVELLLHSRQEVAFVSGRTTAEGDPILPSRIAFLRPDHEVPERVGRAVVESQRAEDVTAGIGDATRPFVPGIGEEPERWSASAIGDFLACPYQFWLKRIARLQTVRDDERELDPLRFGNLTHAVLERFGTSDLAASQDKKEIIALLRDTLHDEALQRFGKGSYPAVQVQLHQLEYRLRRFAEWQVGRVQQGWRIVEVEWKAAEDQRLDLPGGGEAVIVGSVDRIDRHADGRFAILDYKTGDRASVPNKDTRGAKGEPLEWVRVQLPLYAWYARSIVGATPELGYLNLGSDGFSHEAAKWDPGQVESGLDACRNAITEARALLASNEPFPRGDGRIWEPIFKAIVGEQLIGAGSEE